MFNVEKMKTGWRAVIHLKAPIRVMDYENEQYEVEGELLEVPGEGSAVLTHDGRIFSVPLGNIDAVEIKAKS